MDPINPIGQSLAIVVGAPFHIHVVGAPFHIHVVGAPFHIHVVGAPFHTDVQLAFPPR
jgi:hypothetical protein